MVNGATRPYFHSERRKSLMEIGVAEGVRQVAAVDMTELNSGKIEISDVRRLAPDFQVTFKSLLRVMEIQETKEHKKQATQPKSSMPVSSQPTIAGQKRPPQSPVSGPAKRTRQDSSSPPSEPKTPDQPTYPADPDYTGLSIESKDEETTKKLLFNLLGDSMSVLEEGFTRITWQRSGHRVYIGQTFSFFMYFLIVEKEILPNLPSALRPLSPLTTTVSE